MNFELVARRVTAVAVTVWLGGFVVIPLVWGFHTHIGRHADTSDPGLQLLVGWSLLVVMVPAGLIAIAFVGTAVFGLYAWALGSPPELTVEERIAQLEAENARLDKIIERER